MRVSGEWEPRLPKNGKVYTMAEVKEALNDAHVTLIILRKTGEMMFVDEEGEMRGLPPNPVATEYLRENGRPLPYPILGDAFVCNDRRFK